MQYMESSAPVMTNTFIQQYFHNNKNLSNEQALVDLRAAYSTHTEGFLSRAYS